MEHRSIKSLNIATGGQEQTKSLVVKVYREKELDIFDSENIRVLLSPTLYKKSATLWKHCEKAKKFHVIRMKKSPLSSNCLHPICEK
jgi:hypothetical protein